MMVIQGSNLPTTQAVPAAQAVEPVSYLGPASGSGIRPRIIEGETHVAGPVILDPPQDMRHSQPSPYRVGNSSAAPAYPPPRRTGGGCCSIM